MVLNTITIKSVLYELGLSDRLTIKSSIEDAIDLIRTGDYALLILEVPKLKKLKSRVESLRKILNKTSFAQLPKIIHVRQNTHNYRPLNNDRLK